MKITCTVAEFAKMVRRCNDNNCYMCAFSDICGDEVGIERFVSAEDVIPEPAWPDRYIYTEEKHE